MGTGILFVEGEKLMRKFHLVVVAWALCLIWISSKSRNVTEDDRFGAASHEFVVGEEPGVPAGMN